MKSHNINFEKLLLLHGHIGWQNANAEVAICQ
ncbi:hypothetical protein T11_12628 [Trichinella zimbabwensis]|uniref:Uncharacterized protein n=1 Tax=Trichinella zimbabwensis TaxID=268475 RepID=A0A0V1GIK0_9BILA|nr:hypothetical protein T11_12628 [Trichinella zimbabwensis]